MSLPDPTPNPTTPPVVTPVPPQVITPPGGPLPAGLSPAMIDLLRKLVKDADFRLEFIADPVLAVTTAGIRVTTAELEKVKQIIPYLGQLASGVAGLTGSPVGLKAGVPTTETTHTLVYAVALALAFAALIA